MMKFGLFFGLCLPALVAGAALRSHKTNTSYTINDKIFINGNEIASGAGISSVEGCNAAPKESTTVKVCGCAVKVIASLLTECQPYGKYSHAVGHCDCGNSACAESELKSGYTEEFNWKAASYLVEAC
mmetsp:Transcript_110133/g.218772  ORF Transcript_110133/g.218772 Transcript_110133/m.218772 type:complete len:128 (+) Transcript_110133:61-444(+)